MVEGSNDKSDSGEEGGGALGAERIEHLFSGLCGGGEGHCRLGVNYGRVAIAAATAASRVTCVSVSVANAAMGEWQSP